MDEQLSFNYFNDWALYPESTIYSIHRSGYVFNNKKKVFLKVNTLKNGYQQVYILGRKMYLHQVMSKTFLGDYSTFYEPDHINNVRGDNRIENLQLLTHRENCIKRSKKG